MGDNRSPDRYYQNKYRRKPYNRNLYIEGQARPTGSYQYKSSGYDHVNREHFNPHYKRKYRNGPGEHSKCNSNNSNNDINLTQTERTNLLFNPVERKAKEFLGVVLKQPGIRSKLILLESDDNAVQTLQGSADYFRMRLSVDTVGNSGNFVLKINEEEIVQGGFPSKQAAKNSLAEQALEILKKDCFLITKKKVYEEVYTKDNQPPVEAESQSSLHESKAYQMMVKMGWGGKGLGVNEQGTEKTLAETIDQNISRQGLGNSDVLKKVNKILEDYSNSQKISLLRFDPDFTSEERAHIHKIALKFGLKSKSEGKGEQRRITVTKKLHRADLVFNLLVSEMENSLYKLHIPSSFAHLWEAK